MNRSNSNKGRGKQGSPASVVIASFCALCFVSMLPWGEITGNRLKNFNLFSDIIHSTSAEYVTEEIIDPALSKALADNEQILINTEPVERKRDSIIITSSEAEGHCSEFLSPRVDGFMALEDYSGGVAVSRLRNAAESGTLRCAMIGDSYIEGDIFAGSIRRRLQDLYGGEGVGYVPMTSAVAGFRRTVRIKSKGFSACDIRNELKDSLHTLPGEYFRAARGAEVSFKGEKGGYHTGAWSRSRIIFTAPQSGVISTSTDGQNWIEHTVEASEKPQCISVDGLTSRFDVRCDIDGLIVFGAWLDSPSGVSYDCMSLRGYSGISHRNMSISTSRSIAEWVDYDLIVIEYGMNALSSQQTDYTPYGNIMKRVLLRLKACYPDAAIIMLGVGDRGQKQGTSIASLPTTAALVDAQRSASRDVGVMFWDTREAMGGEDAIVEWRERGLVNADYIHLNNKGGEEMSAIFVESLMRVLQ